MSLKSPYLFFLTTFLVPHTADNLPILSSDEWTQLLGEDPLVVTRQFEEQGLVVRSSLALHLECKFRVEELKSYLEQHGLPLSGRKDELIQRLINADYDGMWNVVSDLRILECSEQGTQLAERFLRSVSQQSGNDVSRELQIPTEKLLDWAKWIGLAATSGVIGNLVYDILKSLCEDMFQLLRLPTPTPTPTIQSPPIGTPTVSTQPKMLDDTNVKFSVLGTWNSRDTNIIPRGTREERKIVFIENGEVIFYRGVFFRPVIPPPPTWTGTWRLISHNLIYIKALEGNYYGLIDDNSIVGYGFNTTNGNRWFWHATKEQD